MMVVLRLDSYTFRNGNNLARPDDRTIDDGRASKCEQKMGINFG